MNYQINPKNFNPLQKVVGCLVEAENTIILLHRKDTSTHGNKWGIPSGKVEKEETEKEAITRELKEETNLEVKISKIKHVKTYKVRHYPRNDFIYSLFYTKLEKKEKLNIRKAEHKNARWISPEEALKLLLIPGTNKCIKDFYNNKK